MHQLGGHLSNFSRLAGQGYVLIEREIEPDFRGILHILSLSREYCCGASRTPNGRTYGCSFFAASDRADGRSDTGSATDDCSVLALRGFGLGRVRFCNKGNSLTAGRRPG